MEAVRRQEAELESARLRSKRVLWREEEDPRAGSFEAEQLLELEVAVQAELGWYT